MSPESVIGWDIGGANVKAARLETRTAPPRIVEQPFALWKEPARLAEVLAGVGGRLGASRRHALTMTAELADCYATKREGVAAVLEAFERAFPDVTAAVFGVDGRFRTPHAARREPLAVASANWMASARVAAQAHPTTVLIDVGSTTTDIVPIRDGTVVARGLTDPDRLQAGELVYTGLLRTPVCAIVRELPFRGGACRVAAEWFAIAADAHLWLGAIDAAGYACDTPDGRGRSRRECGARLARMIAADEEMLKAAEITTLAERVVAAQVDDVASGLQQVLEASGPVPYALFAGQGRGLAEGACARLGLPLRELADGRAAPAVAVATLLWQV